MANAPTIGVLAVQGDFREHAPMLRELGATVVEVRRILPPASSGDGGAGLRPAEAAAVQGGEDVRT